MATVYGPDKYATPTGPDAPDVPATIITLLDSMRPSLIGHASSIADRTAKYGSASSSSIQAPAGTVVVSAELNAIWVKTSDTLDEWSTIVQHSDIVSTRGTDTINSDMWTEVRKLTIPETGTYSLFAYASEENGSEDGKIREFKVGIGAMYGFGGSSPASWYWRWTGSRTISLKKGDQLTFSIQQRSGVARPIISELAYQRIL